MSAIRADGACGPIASPSLSLPFHPLSWVLTSPPRCSTPRARAGAARAQRARALANARRLAAALAVALAVGAPPTFARPDRSAGEERLSRAARHDASCDDAACAPGAAWPASAPRRSSPQPRAAHSAAEGDEARQFQHESALVACALAAQRAAAHWRVVGADASNERAWPRRRLRIGGTTRAGATGAQARQLQHERPLDACADAPQCARRPSLQSAELTHASRRDLALTARAEGAVQSHV